MKSSSPSVTLLIPCYNAAPFLPRIMEQVRAQTQPFATVIGYDDGSTDNTAAVAAKLGLALLGPNSNRGVAYARNRLVDAVQNEWFHFHDADDLIDPNFVERLGACCDGGCDVVSCDADWLDETTREIQLRWRYDPAALALDPAAHLIERAMSLNNTIIRTSAWRRIGGCDESLRMWEDADVHIRLALAGARWRHLAEVRTCALRRRESFSHNYRESWLCRLSALQKYAASAGPRPTAVLAAEAERAAGELLHWKDRPAAARALALCRHLGGNPPTTRNPLLRALKPFLPALTLLQWQDRRRRSLQS